jgi:hypothetical protein
VKSIPGVLRDPFAISIFEPVEYLTGFSVAPFCSLGVERLPIDYDVEYSSGSSGQSQ